MLDYIATRQHAERNRTMLLLTHWAGMRVGEVAALRVGDVVNRDGTIKAEIRLDAMQTKGKHARVVYVNEKLRRELAAYVKHAECKDAGKHLFITQKRTAVIGVLDDEGLTRSKAFVVLKQNVDLSDADLKTFVKERLAPYKYPRIIEFVDDLPKTATGKIQRFRLRAREAGPK